MVLMSVPLEPLATPTDPAMITEPGKVCAGIRANGSALAPFVGSVPSLPAEIARKMPAFTARCIALTRVVPGLDPPRERLITFAPAVRAASTPLAIAASPNWHPDDWAQRPALHARPRT